MKVAKTMKMKAILVSGGYGSRLHPFTKYTQKTLLPLFDRPVIDYALGTIRRAGIKDITIIANRFMGQIANHVGCGLPGERIHYVLEEKPEGVRHALNLARPHNQNCRLLIYFSDNITTMELKGEVEAFTQAENPPGCLLLAREEANPEAFGVAVFDGDENVIDIVEKPTNPPSNMAIGGIYLYDENFWNILDQEFENNQEAFSISDVNRHYVRQKLAKIQSNGEDTWVDCGTPEGLFQAGKMAFDQKLNPQPHR